MHIPSLIERKREGHPLSSDEIHHLIAAFTSGDMPDYQMSALAMAIFFQGMSSEEISALTDAMLHSGRVLTWPTDAPPRVDKHSTGGIGDNRNLFLADQIHPSAQAQPIILETVWKGLEPLLKR